MTDLIGRNIEIVLADPPWRYDFSRSRSREIERHYPTMSLPEIMALPVPEICADRSMLFLWATSPKLPEALAVIEAWGFTYKTGMVWDKERLGMGHYARIQHEHLLIANRGGYPTPPSGVRQRSVFRSHRSTHSRKPDVVHEFLEEMYPSAPRIELFARRRRKGWLVWGNEM